MPIDYSLTTHDEAYNWMLYHQRCWKCGNPIDETVTKLGVMLTCVALARESGERDGQSVGYEVGQPSCGAQWWVDEDGDEA